MSWYRIHVAILVRNNLSPHGLGNANLFYFGAARLILAPIISTNALVFFESRWISDLDTKPSSLPTQQPQILRALRNRVVPNCRHDTVRHATIVVGALTRGAYLPDSNLSRRSQFTELTDNAQPLRLPDCYRVSPKPSAPQGAGLQHIPLHRSPGSARSRQSQDGRHAPG
jgi:hypothetical protein